MLKFNDQINDLINDQNLSHYFLLAFCLKWKIGQYYKYIGQLNLCVI